VTLFKCLIIIVLGMHIISDHGHSDPVSHYRKLVTSLKHYVDQT